MTNLTLSLKHGLNPTIPEYCCPICASKFDGNEIWLLGRIKGDAQADMHTQVGFKVCEPCQKLLNDGMKCLVVIDETKSNKGSSLKQEQAYRTGELLWIKAKVFNNFTGQKKLNMCFISEEASDLIKSKVNGGHHVDAQ